MAHLDTVSFDPAIAYGVTYGPEFATEVVGLASAIEKRNALRVHARCVGECAHGLKTQAQLNALLKFFRSVSGRLHTWRFKDWSDYAAASGEGFVTGLTTTTFQLTKLYFTATGFQEIRTVQAPVAATFALRDGATLLAAGTDYTLNTAGGIVTTTIARTAANLTWTGEFDNVCRFDTDRMAVAVEKYQAYTWGQIPIIEVLI